MPDPLDQSPASVIARLVSEHYKPDLKLLKEPGSGVEAPVLLLPSPAGIGIHQLKPLFDPYRDRPERRTGTAHFQTLGSFIDHVNRFRDPASALFASIDPVKPSLLCVLDYHEPLNTADGAASPDPAPRWGKHRAAHAFPLSAEWQAWVAQNKQPMNQSDFACFIEDRILDILPAPSFAGDLSAQDAKLQAMAALLGGTFAGPERMMGLSRGLIVHERSKIGATVNLASGEGSIEFENEHIDGTGQKLAVPSLFCIGLSVFDSGALYRLTARLRYRRQGAALSWWYELYRADLVFRDAVREACERAAAETELPLFFGAPEA